MNEKILPRHRAASFQLEEGPGASPIQVIFTCDEFMEMYTVNKTFSVQTPEGIDPEQMNPNALWVTTPIDDVGSSNQIVARILLQANEILKAASFKNDVNKNKVRILLHKCKKHLLACERIAIKITAKIDQIISKIKDEGIPLEKNGRGLNPFPHVQGLEDDCRGFLIEVNHAIKSICELPSLFFRLDDADKNFKYLAKRLRKNLKEDAPLLKFIIAHSQSVERIIELRNGLEHREDKKTIKKTIINNFKLTPDTKIKPPVWSMTGEGEVPIQEEMNEIVRFLLEAGEAMFIHLVIETLKKDFSFLMVKVEDSKIDPNFPKRFKLIFDTGKIMEPFK